MSVPTTAPRIASTEWLFDILQANNIHFTTSHDGPSNGASQESRVAPSTEQLVSAITDALEVMGIHLDTPLLIPAALHATIDAAAQASTTAQAPDTIALPTATPASAGTSADVPSASPPGALSAAHSPQPDSTLVTGFVCVNCNTHNLIRPAKETWYTVTVGRQVGVFQAWHTVQPLVSGAPGACYRKFSSRDAAQAAFDEATAQGNVTVVP